MGSDIPVPGLTMRNILQFSLIFLCFIAHLTEAIFFGLPPSYHGYHPFISTTVYPKLLSNLSCYMERLNISVLLLYLFSHHYETSYNTWYQKPRRHYYYSSSPYSYRRGKRETEHPEMVELRRIKREVESGGFDINNWYRDMTEMDQDGCGKKLICELRAKEETAKGFTEDERLIAENFGRGNQVDVSDITVEYDLAAQMGRFMGLERCRQLYNRCDLSSDDMVTMIKTEMDTLDRMKRDLENEEIELDVIERAEVEETEKDFELLAEDDGDAGKNWVWTK